LSKTIETHNRNRSVCYLNQHSISD